MTKEKLAKKANGFFKFLGKKYDILIKYLDKYILGQFVVTFLKYMLFSVLAPAVALIITIFIYYSRTHQNYTWNDFSLLLPHYYKTFITDPITFTHTFALLLSLWAQISIATFYETREYFSSAKFKYTWLKLISLLTPVISTSFVIASLSTIHNHVLQMKFNYAYLITIVIWDLIYWRFTECVNPTATKIKFCFERCRRNSQGILISDFAVLLSFKGVAIASSFFTLTEENSLYFEAGSFGAILFFSAFLLINDLREWHEKENKALEEENKKNLNGVSTQSILANENLQKV